MKLNRYHLLLVGIVLIGGAFRFTGLNWDSSYHLHPDERFLTMVSQSMLFPSRPQLYFDTFRSTLNPHNLGFPFYVYGTFPVIFVKLLSLAVSLDTYDGFTLVGRFVSALLDTATIVLVFLLSRRLFNNFRTGVWSAFFYALCVLPVQMSHYFTVDSFSVFFLTLSLCLIPAGWLISSAVLGLAVASKINILFFLPLYFVLLLISRNSRSIFNRIINLLLSGFGIIVSVRLFQPYLFIGLGKLNPLILSNWQQLKSFENPGIWFPPAVQWLTAPKLLFSLNNMFFWGLGPALFLVGFLSLFYVLLSQKYPWAIKIIGFTIIANLVYQGWQFAQPLRYLYPVYPLLSVFGGLGISFLFVRFRALPHRLIMIGIFIFWPLAFVSVYYRPNTRVVASDWINRFIPPGSIISCEHWDDCLPLGYQNRFTTLQLPLFDPDTPEKADQLSEILSRLDYLILSSNRLYGAIPGAPAKYPQTSGFYADLFSGRLGFTLLAQFTSRPNLPVPGIHFCLTPPFNTYGFISRPLQSCLQPGISIVDDYADETFTVYDHPKVFIFQKSPQTIQ